MSSAVVAPPRRTRARRPHRRGGFLFGLVVLPLLVAMAAGLMARHVGGGGSWPVQLVAIGLPYAAWAAAGITALAGATQRRRWALALAVPVLLVALRAWPGTVATPAPGDLVLTSFNVPQPDQTQTTADSVTAFVGRTAPHLVGFQDAWVYPGSDRRDWVHHIRALVDRQPYRLAAPTRLNPRQGWQRRGLGTPLVVRTTARPADSTGATVAVLDQQEIQLGRGDDVSLALRTRFRWQGHEAILYNVHLRSYGNPRPWNDPDVRLTKPDTWPPYFAGYRRVFASRHGETDRLAERIATETLPVIVAGDFNSTADHYTVSRLRHARDGAPFVDAYRHAAGWRWGRTYHARNPLVRIDFVLVDPEAFEVTGARTYPASFSDHRPVEVHLRWKE